MSWNRIVLPLVLPKCADTVEIGRLVWDCYLQANKPDGFAMFHSDVRGEPGSPGSDDKRIIYLSPVASEVCREISEKYPFEPCRVPARDEPLLAYVFGDPTVKGHLRDSMDTDELVHT
jgi:hypothetical protein